MPSILSKTANANGYFTGFRPGDSRQISVRLEGQAIGASHYKAYVGGHIVWNGDDGYGFETKGDAEAAAIEWAEENPPDEEDA